MFQVATNIEHSKVTFPPHPFFFVRFLDEVQSYSGVNKMSVQNLATVFGPNILRPKVEDPVAIMEGRLVSCQLCLRVCDILFLIVSLK